MDSTSTEPAAVPSVAINMASDQVHSMLFFHAVLGAAFRDDQAGHKSHLKFLSSLPLELVIFPHYPETFNHRSKVHL